jgi:hypothetical protein
MKGVGSGVREAFYARLLQLPLIELCSKAKRGIFRQLFTLALEREARGTIYGSNFASINQIRAVETLLLAFCHREFNFSLKSSGKISSGN